MLKIPYLMIFLALGVINDNIGAFEFILDDDKILRNTKLLSCASSLSKLKKHETNLVKIAEKIILIKEIIHRHDLETSNFVYLILLRHCYMAITTDIANKILIEDGNLQEDFSIALFDIDYSVNEFLNNNSEKRNDIIKELKILHDTLKDLGNEYGYNSVIFEFDFRGESYINSIAVFMYEHWGLMTFAAICSFLLIWKAIREKYKSIKNRYLLDKYN